MITADLSVTTKLFVQSLQQGARPFLTVSSDSMNPLIYQGDEIQLVFTDYQDLEVGDVIVVGDAAGLLAHRYWSTLSRNDSVHLILRGDRLKEFDSPYPVDRLIGRVIARRRNGVKLDLSQGIGRWLNSALKKMASVAVTIPGSHNQGDEPHRSNAAPKPRQSLRLPRLPLFGILFVSARILAVFVDVINRIQRIFVGD